ncbi:MAG: hypothetical protein WAL25_05440, partial [Acidimicrobiia bacterium]
EQGLTTEQLMAKLEELDARDGVTDGRMTSMPTPCVSCGSKVPADLTKCQFCGAEVPNVDDHPLGQI